LVDLTATTTKDLTDYPDTRQQEVQDTTLTTEFGCSSSFFYFAIQVGWMDKDPIPRWGRNNRNTLISRNAARASRALPQGSSDQTLPGCRPAR
jgi:hypothetical protein